MAPRASDQFAAPLRLINNRLSSTPTWQLPHVVPYLASTIAACGPVLSNSDEHAVRHGPDSATLVHRVKTRISTLLQDKSPQARWAAVALVKATVEAGRLEILRGSRAWVQSMISILGKPDPASTKKLCMITLTRCLLLTQGYPSIVRELTTPVLPAFLSACLKLLYKPLLLDESLLLVTLQALDELLPYHPAVFRPFQAQLRSCLLPMLAPTPSSLQQAQPDHDEGILPFTGNVANSARRTYVLLSVCAPKKTETDDWAKSVRLVCDTIHTTADSVFRALVEDRGSSMSRQPLKSAAETVSSHEGDPMGLPCWKGIQGGIERLVGLLRTLQAFIATSAEHVSTVPVGVLLDISNRVLSVPSPSSGPHTNPEIGRDEREGLLHGLPHVHAATIDLVSSLIQRLGQGAAPFYQEPLEHCLWVLNLEKSSVELRTAVYSIIRHLSMQFGLSFPKSLRAPLSNSLRLCCEELLSSATGIETANSDMVKGAQNSNANGASLISVDSYTKSTPKRPQQKQSQTNVQLAAAKLLQVALSCLPDGFLPRSVRAQMDRTATLTEDEDTLLASVLYPAITGQGNQATTSIMPFLARAFPGSSPVEALMKPRMPVIQTKQNGHGLSYGHENNLEMEEPAYDHLYSGSGISNFEVPERRSMVEDSMQAETTLHRETTASASNELFSPSYSQPQTAAASMVEVPETQPISVASSTKRGRDDAVEGHMAVQLSNIEVQQVEPTVEANPAFKRPRTERSPPQTLKPSVTHNVAHLEQTETAPTGVSFPTDTYTAPTLSTKEANIEEVNSDSDDSSIPHIDTTLSTDEEDEDGEDDVETKGPKIDVSMLV